MLTAEPEPLRLPEPEPARVGTLDRVHANCGAIILTCGLVCVGFGIAQAVAVWEMLR